MKLSGFWQSIVIILLAGIPALAQAVNEMGVKLYGSYFGSEFDMVNVSNGHLELRIPIEDFPQRGGKLKLTFVARYNNAVWNETHECSPAPDSICTFTWASSTGMPGVQLGAEQAPPQVLTTCINACNTTSPFLMYSIVMPDGSQHPTGGLGGTLYESIDATGLLLDPSNGNLTLADGTHYLNMYSANPVEEDTNGNQIFWGPPIGDSIGRNIPALPHTSGQNVIGNTTSDFTGCTGLLPITAATLWSVPGSNGAIETFKFCFANVTIFMNHAFQTNCSVSQCLQPDGPYPMLQSIVLPDGTAWTFDYTQPDSTGVNWGDLAKITFPTGGSISYAWNHSTGCTEVFGPPGSTNGAVTSRTVNANDGTGGHTWTYAFGVITDPLGNDTVHSFTDLNKSCSFFETQTQYYRGSSTSGSGTLLKTITTDYSWSINPNVPSGSAAAHPPMNVVPIRHTTTLSNGLVQKIEYTYDAGFTFQAQYTGIYGKQTAANEFDYANGSPGPLLRSTATSYLWQTNSNYITYNILDVPSSIKISDGNGNKVAQSTNGYDETLPASSGITVSHDTNPANGNIRGNLTSVNHWLNGTAFSTPNCPVSVSNGFISQAKSYLDTGMVSQSKDGCGNSSTFQYAVTPYYGAYLTTSCDALNHCTNIGYNLNPGLPANVTDPNSNTTGHSYDNVGRLTIVTYPDGGQTNYSYPTPAEIDKSVQVTLSLPDQSKFFFDGLGRTSQTQHITPGGTATVNTSYDALGRVASVTNPYFSTSDPTYGVTQAQYDALNRVTQVTKQDGSVVTTQYDLTSSNSPNGDCTMATDEAGKIRKSCVDGMGRLIEVDEPGPGANSGGTPGSGSITISGSLSSSTTSGTKATGWFAVSGTDTWVYACQANPDILCNPNPKLNSKIWDHGSVSVTINGVLGSASYSQNSTDAGLASSIASGLNPHPVTYTSNGAGTINVTADVPGPNYSMSGSSSTGDPTDFSGASFGVQVSGSTLTGGVYPVTTYDSGTLTVTVDGFQASASYNQNQNSTAAAMAQALTNALNAAGSPVTAFLSGTTITLTSKAMGANYTVTGSSTASFTASSTTLSGGTKPSGIYAPYVTLYSYDTLGNLLQVNQKGDGSQAARVRTFTYDSLSRLLTAANPESGTISYAYDANGNVLAKTSPAPNQLNAGTTQTISYCYDVLNRRIGKGYGVQSCPLSSSVVTYNYDAGTNGVGRLTSLTDQPGTGAYTYDTMGRILGESRKISGNTMNLAYSYNLDGSVAKLTYPSGAVITYTPWNNGTIATGFPQSAVDGASNISYVTGATYGPDMSLTGFISGNSSSFSGITNFWQYNQRMQICRITALTAGTAPKSCTDSNDIGNVLDLGYNMNLGAGDNGNVIGITNYKDLTRSQSFTYDQLNRLISAQSAGTDCSQSVLNATKFWGNSYGYDAWGNLLSKSVTKCSAESLSATADAQNRLHSAAGADYQYDAAGNMTTNVAGPLAPQTYTYDVENRIIGAGSYTYTYDDEGNRVKKSNGTTGTIYWYMSPGIVAESDFSGNLKSEYVFFAGDRAARKDFFGSTTSVSYYFSDHLKTTSVTTNSAGTITEDEDYNPWGGEIQFVNSDSNHYKFTGKERDGESNLDNFGARYYSDAPSRFMSPDWSGGPETVPYADLANPQSLNLYSYVLNSPATSFDVDGHVGGPPHLIDCSGDKGSQPECQNRGNKDPKDCGRTGCITLIPSLRIPASKSVSLSSPCLMIFINCGRPQPPHVVRAAPRRQICRTMVADGSIHSYYCDEGYHEPTPNIGLAIFQTLTLTAPDNCGAGGGEAMHAPEETQHGVLGDGGMPFGGGPEVPGGSPLTFTVPKITQMRLDATAADNRYKNQLENGNGIGNGFALPGNMANCFTNAIAPN